jgi:PadR family transcriptional regulator, regulatory protein AphA
VTVGLPETTYAVLGLVDKAPGSSGYDLVGVAGRSFAYFWPISQTLLYRELHRLTELGWVSATRVDQTHLPGKWAYATTAAGRQALVDWLDTPAGQTSTFRSSVLLRFFFAHRMSPPQLRELLAGYRQALQAQRDELEAVVDKLTSVPTPAARTGRLAALHGIRTADARLAWIDEVEALIGQDWP